VKILFLVQTLNCGGMERQLFYLATGLREQGHQVAVGVFYPKGSFMRIFMDAGIPIKVLEKRGRWDILGFSLRVRRLLKEERPDVLYSILGIPNILTVLFKPCYPSMRIIWGVRASNMDLRYYDRMVQIAYWVECRLAQFPDLRVANSHAGVAYAVGKGFPKEKMVVISNGFDTRRIKPDLTGRQRMREEWKVGRDEILIGLVGRIDPMKGHHAFLQAAQLLIQKCSGVRFVCVGGGEEAQKGTLIQRTADLGLKSCLIWEEERPDIEVVYNAFDVACSSSVSEGFSNVIGEAMASGVPCVVTDVGDSKWIVGDTGVVVPPGDPYALCSAWLQLITLGGEKRRDLGLMARERILTHFNIENLISRTSQVIERDFREETNSTDDPAFVSRSRPKDQHTSH